MTLPTTNLIPLVILKLTRTPNTLKSPPKPQKCQKRPKMAENGQNPKTAKNQIDPYSSPVMFTIISEFQKGLKTLEK